MVFSTNYVPPLRIIIIHIHFRPLNKSLVTLGFKSNGSLRKINKHSGSAGDGVIIERSGGGHFDERPLWLENPPGFSDVLRERTKEKRKR